MIFRPAQDSKLNHEQTRDDTKQNKKARRHSEVVASSVISVAEITQQCVTSERRLILFRYFLVFNIGG